MNKEHEQRLNSVRDIELLDDLDNIRVQLSIGDSEQPDSSMDKQIIAAAHREANRTIKVKPYRASMIQKLSLPLYIVSGFVLTVFAYNSLWYSPIKSESNESEHATVIDIDQNQEQQLTVDMPKVRQSRTLPEHIPPGPIPDRVVTQPTLEQSAQNGQITSELTLIEQGIYTGSELNKADFPEKEAWVRAIIKHLRNGETKQAREQLVRFKSAYPNYPIEEQIKSLNR